MDSLGLGFVLANVTSKILDNVDNKLVGYASSLTTFLQMNFGGIGVIISSYLYNSSVIPLGLIMLVCSIVSLLCLYKSAFPNSSVAIDNS